MSIPINYWAVIVSAIVSLALGFLWYGPLFGKIWRRLMGMSPEDSSDKKNMASTIVINIICALLMAFTLKNNLVFGSAYLNITGVEAGLQAGFWNWLGFIAPVTIGAVLWDKKPWKLWFLNAGYYLVSLLLMGIILAVWI